MIPPRQVPPADRPGTFAAALAAATPAIPLGEALALLRSFRHSPYGRRMVTPDDRTRFWFREVRHAAALGSLLDHAGGTGMARRPFRIGIEAGRAQLSQPSLISLIAESVADGDLRRLPWPEDRRLVLLGLAPQMQAWVETLAGEFTAAAAGALGRADPLAAVPARRPAAVARWAAHLQEGVAQADPADRTLTRRNMLMLLLELVLAEAPVPVARFVPEAAATLTIGQRTVRNLLAAARGLGLVAMDGAVRPLPPAERVIAVFAADRLRRWPAILDAIEAAPAA